MHPDEVPHEYVMAAMKAAGLLHHDTARPALAAVLPLYRAALAEEFAVALLAVDPVEWALAGQHAGADAAALIRRLADAATPTSKEQQR